MKTKPLGIKGYGSIPHLPDSRTGPGDHKISQGQADICNKETRDRHDEIIVTEKLDGSNVSITRIGDEVIALTRAGLRCTQSRFPHHHMFAQWVRESEIIFNCFLKDKERIVGEWIALAHGTRYKDVKEPFLAFDIISVINEREPYNIAIQRFDKMGLSYPKLLHRGGAASIDYILKRLGRHGHHGATDKAEGAVWRVERKGIFDFLAKYVRPEKKDGILLVDENNKQLPDDQLIWNWKM